MAQVEQLSAADLRDLVAQDASIELVDVRTEEEREIACIEGSRLLDKPYFDHLVGLDRQTLLVFQCHHGVRSQAAAEYFLSQGFERVYNLIGGIDAWSQDVDPAVPRY